MITVRNLSCRRSGRQIFRAVDFNVEAGGYVAVMGPNGSGKSTLLRVLAGLIAPHAGEILWAGASIEADPAAHQGHLRYIGHLDAVKPSLTVQEMLDYWRILRGSDGRDVAAAFALTRLLDHPVRSLSAGQKRRLSLTRLSLDQAPLWLLDEPTTALDAEGQSLLLAQIARHRAAGGIVIAATHDELNVANAQRLEMTGASR